MAKYIFACHGGKMPETGEEGARVMTDWMAWLKSPGDSVVDSGNPAGPSSTVHSDGSASCDGGSEHVAGRYLRDIPFGHQFLGLRALAGAGRAQQYDAHL